MIISYQFFLLVVFTTSGVICGWIVDSYYWWMDQVSLKKWWKRHQWVFEYTLWIALGIATYALLFYLYDGIWRIYLPLAQIIGFLLYSQYFQSFFRAISKGIFIMFIRPIWWVLHLGVYFVRQIVRVVSKIIFIGLYPFIRLTLKIYRSTLKKYGKIRYNSHTNKKT